jgi:hypothetical protein
MISVERGDAKVQYTVPVMWNTEGISVTILLSLCTSVYPQMSHSVPMWYFRSTDKLFSNYLRNNGGVSVKLWWSICQSWCFVCSCCPCCYFSCTAAVQDELSTIYLIHHCLPLTSAVVFCKEGFRAKDQCAQVNRECFFYGINRIIIIYLYGCATFTITFGWQWGGGGLGWLGERGHVFWFLQCDASSAYARCHYFSSSGGWGWVVCSFGLIWSMCTWIEKDSGVWVCV